MPLIVSSQEFHVRLLDEKVPLKRGSIDPTEKKNERISLLVDVATTAKICPGLRLSNTFLRGSLPVGDKHDLVPVFGKDEGSKFGRQAQFFHPFGRLTNSCPLRTLFPTHSSQESHAARARTKAKGGISTPRWGRRKGPPPRT
jgi:hypothetical protein